MTDSSATRTEYGLSRWQWALLAVVVVGVAVLFRRTIPYVVANWQREEYSHGFLIPVVTLLLLWQRRRQLQQTPFRGSWAGALLTLAGIGLYFVGAFAAIATLDAYGLVIVIAGLFLALTGWQAFRIALPALALLLLMVPIPSFFFNSLSSALQLISSQLGVLVIRAFGISVHLDGNVIDLGSYQLQVVEACSGLRYLFPLLTLGIILASLVRLPLWIRLMIVFSTVPITVLMNSFRIGVIGVLVEHYGIEQAEGFLHDFEGWIIFMSCFVLLALETWLLARLAGDRRSLRDVIAIDWPESRPAGTPVVTRAIATAFAVAGAFTLVAALGAHLLPGRTEVVPMRADFTRFPMHLGDWQGRRDRIEDKYLDTLMLDDYLLADYRDGEPTGVNFYVAYYSSQRNGRSAHSPASCLPGGGWRMSELGQHEVAGVSTSAGALQVNRAIIELGGQRQLVYYWFKQRSRSVTNEYLVKVFLLWDSLFRNRSDGALVRLITPLAKGEDAAAGDSRLAQFATQVAPLLGQYVPD
jgi:exosortase D (VPLPA-CTERM-specific)